MSALKPEIPAVVLVLLYLEPGLLLRKVPSAGGPFTERVLRRFRRWLRNLPVLGEEEGGKVGSPAEFPEALADLLT